MINSNNIKILIIDQNPVDLLPFAHMPENQEYTFIRAGSDKEGLDFAKTNSIALVIIGLHATDYHGFQTAEKLKANKNTSLVPIIFITSTATEEAHVANGYKAGAVDYIIKPVSPEIIESKIKVFVDLFKLRLSAENRAAERLRSSEAKYKSLFDTSRDGIAFMSLEGNIEKANQAYCDMLGYNLNDLIFTTYQQHTPQKWVDKDKDILLNQVMKRDYSDEYNKEYIRKDKTIFPVMVRIWLVRDDKGAPLRLLKVVRDFTDQTRLETQLRQAQKMESIGTLAGGIAHDFNNILGAIIGYAQLARYNINDMKTALQDIDQVLTASNRAKDLVKHILGFSRLSEHAMQPIQVHHIAKEALKLIRASLPSTIEIRQNVATSSTTIMADPTEIHQVLMNFCTNALHAMEKTGGVLKVKIAPVESEEIDYNIHPDLKPGPHLKLVVSDTGCGIKHQHIERIFDPYFTTKKKGTGTGLGLAVVHGIIKNHGGSVSVRSKHDEGTVMTVYFPRIEAITEQVVHRKEILPTGSETILFVDDEKSLVEIEKNMLQRLGYQVISESSSVKAFHTFCKKPNFFDIVITDMTMPEMTGLELAREITIIKPGIPIILCTGYNKKITEKIAKESGISTLLLKPVEIRDLAVSIRSLIDNNREKQTPTLG